MSEDFGNHGDDEVDEEEKAMENFDHDPSMELPPENLKKYFVNIPIPGPRCRQCKRRIKSRPWIERADFCGPKCQREHLKMLHIMENERRRGQSQERRQELERQWQKRRQELEAKLHDADERVADILKELETRGLSEENGKRFRQDKGDNRSSPSRGLQGDDASGTHGKTIHQYHL